MMIFLAFVLWILLAGTAGSCGVSDETIWLCLAIMLAGAFAHSDNDND